MEKRYLKRTRNAFYHSYESYIENAFPKYGEIDPITCKGTQSWGDALTLIDSLDTLAVLESTSLSNSRKKFDFAESSQENSQTEFSKMAKWVSTHIDFNKDVNVSVFETNIRILGGLLSSHILLFDSSSLSNYSSPLDWGWSDYSYQLLDLAEDLGDRLLSAFTKSKTGLPYGTVNLRYGVPEGETPVVCSAGAGSFLLEFGVLSSLLLERDGDGHTSESCNPMRFANAAFSATMALHSFRDPKTDLVGSHIDAESGHWTQRDSGIGHSVDSFYEYLLKSHVLFGGSPEDDSFFLRLFVLHRHAVGKLRFGPWFVEAEMGSGRITWPHFDSLQCFWPGLEVLFGDIDVALKVAKAFSLIWRQNDFTAPERLDLVTGKVVVGQSGYPLRPEMIESLYHLHSVHPEATEFSEIAAKILDSILKKCRVRCGFAGVRDVGAFNDFESSNSLFSEGLDGKMHSYFLAETLKYLFLIFDSENFVNKGNYIFSTEAHLFPVRKQFSSIYSGLISDTLSRQWSMSSSLFNPKVPVHSLCQNPGHARMLDYFIWTDSSRDRECSIFLFYKESNDSQGENATTPKKGEPQNTNNQTNPSLQIDGIESPPSEEIQNEPSAQQEKLDRVPPIEIPRSVPRNTRPTLRPQENADGDPKTMWFFMDQFNFSFLNDLFPKAPPSDKEDLLPKQDESGVVGTESHTSLVQEKKNYQEMLDFQEYREFKEFRTRWAEFEEFKKYQEEKEFREFQKWKKERRERKKIQKD